LSRGFKGLNHLFQAGGMKVQAKKFFRSWGKKTGWAELLGLGLIFAAHTHTHSALSHNALFVRNGAVLPFLSGPVSFGRRAVLSFFPIRKKGSAFL
jgi:hypothetical protein